MSEETTQHEAVRKKLQEQENKLRRKSSYIGVPAYFKLDMACRILLEAFGPGERLCQTYVVGSCLERENWRDVDVVMMVSDEHFSKIFPGIHLDQYLEMNPLWILLTVVLSDWLRAQTGLPIDFKIQPMKWANKRHPGKRDAIGLRCAPVEMSEGTP